MKKLVFLLLAVMLLTACGQDKENDQGAVYVNITAEEAKQIMDTEEGYIILDVRTQEEYDQGHIPGAILISHEEIAEKAEDVLTDKNQLILVYCRSGRAARLRRKPWWNWDIPTSRSLAASSTGLMRWSNGNPTGRQ